MDIAKHPSHDYDAHNDDLRDKWLVETENHTSGDKNPLPLHILFYVPVLSLTQIERKAKTSNGKRVHQKPKKCEKNL